MAIGDAAAAQGLDIMDGTEDRRDGWQEINLTRDYLAGRTESSDEPGLHTYTPVFTNVTFGSSPGGVKYAKYRVRGGICEGFISAEFGPGFVAGINWFMTLPVPVAASFLSSEADIADVKFRDVSETGAGHFPGDGYLTPEGTIRLGYFDASGPRAIWAAITSGSPFTFAVGDKMSVQFEYPIE
jgi:hypothetical protein